jgi:hypothetical protein
LIADNCPAQTTACLTNTCELGCCGTSDAPKGTKCTDNDGSVCNATGTCVECNSVSDCTSTTCNTATACDDGTCAYDPAARGTSCADGGICDGAGACAAATCTDGFRDGNETDTDCGGADSCPRCTDGETCEVDTDCVTGDGCKTSPPGAATCIDSCEDGHLDGSETDIDCGGSCPGCAGGEKCLQDTDCLSNLCNSGICAP